MGTAFLIAVSIMLAGDAFSQGLGTGAGVDDLRQLVPKAGASVTPCATNLVFQQNVACNAVAFVMTGY
jgi:hypothetical protein